MRIVDLHSTKGLKAWKMGKVLRTIMERAQSVIDNASLIPTESLLSFLEKLLDTYVVCVQLVVSQDLMIDMFCLHDI